MQISKPHRMHRCKVPNRDAKRSHNHRWQVLVTYERKQKVTKANQHLKCIKYERECGREKASECRTPVPSHGVQMPYHEYLLHVAWEVNPISVTESVCQPLEQFLQ